jgi:hypothetical protein
MKRWISIFAIFAGLAALLASGTMRAQVPAPRPAPPIDSGPGDQGATLKQPWMDPPVKSGLPAGSSIQSMWNPVVNSGLPNRVDPSNPFAGKIALPPTNPTDMNRDLELTKEHGNWVIFLISYAGEKAPQMARKCVIEMRTNPKYKLNAFVFNYGAEEKRKEFDRVQRLKEKLKEEQKQALIKDGVQADIVMPVRVRAMRIDEQTGVLIAGGFKTFERAKEALNSIRNLPDPDPKKVDMDVITDFEERAEPGAGRTPRVNQRVTKQAYISPFVNAFVARNPCLPKETQNADQDKINMGQLAKLNDFEPLSLLKCNKHYTLVVKQFNTQVMVQDRPKQANGFMDNLFKKQESVDYAAKNAATLAELLRRGGCETYVLHTKFCSYVTAGGYDRLDDPRMAGMQTSLQQFFRTLTTGADSRLAQMITQLDLPVQFQTMAIPH